MRGFIINNIQQTSIGVALALSTAIFCLSRVSPVAIQHILLTTRSVLNTRGRVLIFNNQLVVFYIFSAALTARGLLAVIPV
ncbi:hypothetical protein A359_04450 [secondary endosymbiont of Ctenarytaina eucalypti]|uniref:Uncharacterized protein n=1 Tax=secondary endosymbiont of Ctenarytaina eucalypti TaxID=1199245 RepID=J3YRU8_9ENTR|nr:hypothetical protein A359_04450 [secondary endosymbiont of Ctenarytaina eucalypti]